jgi:hypothetical protein
VGDRMMTEEPTARLVIYCAAESHADKRFEWEFARFNHPKVGRIWLEQTRVPKASRSNPQSPSFVVLQGNNVLHEDQAMALTARDSSRHRYRLECQLCGLPARGRGEKVDAIFDTIVDCGQCVVSPGVSEVSLSALAARIRT